MSGNNVLSLLLIIISLGCSEKSNDKKMIVVDRRQVTCAESDKIIKTLAAVREDVKAERYSKNKEIIFLETELVKKQWL